MSTNITLDLAGSFEHMRECVFLTAPDQTLVYINKAAEALLGRPRERLLGTEVKALFARPDEIDTLSGLRSKPERNKHTEALQTDLLKGDGTSVAAEVLFTQLLDANGCLSGSLLIVHDLSERHSLQSRLDDLTATLDAALDTISEGFAIYDEDDRLVICNDNYKQIYEESAPAIVPGNQFEDILRYGLKQRQYDTGGLSDDEWMAERLKSHREADGAMIEQHLESGRWLRISEMRTGRRRITGIRADITELKQARAMAERSTSMLSLVAEAIKVGMFEIDVNGVCTFANRLMADWFGTSPERLVGARLLTKLPESDRRRIQSLLERSVYQGQQALQTGLSFPGGGRCECRVECKPHVAASGDLEGHVFFVTQLTDSRKNGETLAALENIAATHELPREEKIVQMLQLAARHFELPNAFVSEIEGNKYTVTYAHAPENEFTCGTDFDLGETYCALTQRANKPMATAHATRSNFGELHWNRKYGLQTYIGAPLLVDGVVWGTVHLSGPEIRHASFQDSDLDVIRQIANRIANEIARQKDHQALLAARTTLERVASFDDLTKAFNRRAFLECATREIQRYRRTRRTFSVAMMDLDNFKKINDQHGHDIGDMVLRRFAEVVSSALRSVDVFGRVGGEEFCILLNETTLEEALLVCERLRKKIIEECQFPEIEQTVTCSLGLAAICTDDIEISGLMLKADTALYEAKRTGRNKCVTFKDTYSRVKQPDGT